MADDKDIQKIFDVFCRKVLTNKLRDYRRSESCQRKHETALLTLPRTEQEIVLLHALGFSDYMISDRVDIPRRTVAEKRKRVLKCLREELETLNPFFSFRVSAKYRLLPSSTVNF